MKIPSVLSVLFVLSLNLPAGEIIRDAAGNVISVTTTTVTGKTTRDAAGTVLEQKQTIRYPDAKTIIVRDAANTVIRTEAKPDSKRR